MTTVKQGIKKKKSKGERIFDTFNIILTIIAFFIFMYPFWNQLILSFNVGTDAVKGGIFFWPREFTFANY